MWTTTLLDILKGNNALLLFFSLQRSGDILCLLHNFWLEPKFVAASRIQVFWVYIFNWLNSVYMFLGGGGLRSAHVPLNSRMYSLLMNREPQCSITGILYVVTLAHNKWGFIDWDKCFKLIFALENSSVLI